MARMSPARIARRAQAEQEQARLANIQRYEQGLQELRAAQDAMRQQFGVAEAGIAAQGQTALQDIQTGAVQAQATGTQGLISQGLMGTTMGANLARAVEQDRARAATRVHEGLASQRAQLALQRAQMEQQASGQVAGWIGARQDVGPDVGIYSALMQQAAQQPQQSGAQMFRNPLTGQMVPVVSRTISPAYKAAMAAPSRSVRESELLRQQGRISPYGGIQR